MEGFSRQGQPGGEAFDDDAAEGHMMDDRTDNPGETDLRRRRLEDDDTEGHKLKDRKIADDDDTEGHKLKDRKIADEDDTEGHIGLKKRS
jgi:hypothetical protein